jgi:hypothetical protein
MARADLNNTTNALVDLDPEDRVLIERLIDLVQSFEDRAISPQARADVLLQVWQRNRRLPPALRVSEHGAA